MPEHYPKHVTSVMHWCSVCRRRTMHRVDDKRLGSCTEHQAEGLTRKQQKHREKLDQDAMQPGLEGL